MGTKVNPRFLSYLSKAARFVGRGMASLIPASVDAPKVSKKAAKRARTTSKPQILIDAPPSRQVRRAKERAAKKGRANG